MTPVSPATEDAHAPRASLWVAWACAMVAAATLLVAANYQSRDPDSALYAQLSGDLAARPAAQWIAPEWGGAWNQHGLFREHPVGILIPSVLLIRLGFPAHQAAYVVNMAYQVAVILLIPIVAAVVVRAVEARSLAWILQLLPVAFSYRIRGNQEHPLLMCFLAVLYATHRVREHLGWLVLMIAPFCLLVLIKGAFAMFTLVGAALWVLLVPPAAGGSNRRAWIGLLVTLTIAALMMGGYEAIYRQTTGESFFAFYGATRLGGSIQLTDPRVVPHALTNVVWYVTRVLWFAFPWSLFAAAAIVVWVRFRAVGEPGPPLDARTERGLVWAILITAVFIAVLSPALVRAERFIFPTYFVIATVGVVTAIRTVDGIRALVTRADRLVWLPVALWFATFLLSLGSRVVRF